MDAKQEVLNSLQNIWTKLQNLPEANSIEIGGFLILLLFILTFLTMVVFACAQCCCSCGRGSRKNNSVL
ncbi:small integral membrane protein 5 [Tachysurus ichikawai]